MKLSSIINKVKPRFLKRNVSVFLSDMCIYDIIMSYTMDKRIPSLLTEFIKQVYILINTVQTMTNKPMSIFTFHRKFIKQEQGSFVFCWGNIYSVSTVLTFFLSIKIKSKFCLNLFYLTVFLILIFVYYYENI